MTPSARRAFPLDHGHDRGKALEPLQDGAGLVRRDDDREVERDVRPATRVAGHLAAERRCDLLGHGAGAVEREALPGRRRVAVQALEDLPLRVRADPRNLLQAPLAGRGAELLDGPHAEHAPDLEHPLRGDTEEPTEADELRPDVPLELVQLRDRPGLHELAQPTRDPRPDPAQLLGATCARQLRDGRGRLPDGLRGAAVRAGGVALGAGQLEEHGEGVEPLRDLLVGERGRHVATTVPARWRRSSTGSMRRRSTSSSPSGTRSPSNSAPTGTARPPTGSRRCASRPPPSGPSTSSPAGSRRTTARSSRPGTSFARRRRRSSAASRRTSSRRRPRPSASSSTG